MKDKLIEKYWRKHWRKGRSAKKSVSVRAEPFNLELIELQREHRRTLVALVLSVAGLLLFLTGVIGIEVYEWRNPDLTSKRVFLNLLLSWQSACLVSGVLLFLLSYLFMGKK